MRNKPNYPRHRQMPPDFVFISRGTKDPFNSKAPFIGVVGEEYYFSNCERNISGPHVFDSHHHAEWCDLYFKKYGKTWYANLDDKSWKQKYILAEKEIDKLKSKIRELLE